MQDRRAELLDELWRAIDDEDRGRALTLARALDPPPEDSEGTLAVGIALLDGGEHREAKERLEALEGGDLDDDSEFMRRSQLAEACFSLGDPQGALRILRTLEPADPVEAADREWLRGLCHDHLGSTERADACFRRAAELDPEGTPRPVGIAVEEVEALVGAVVKRLPVELQRAFDELPVVIESLPPLELVQKSDGRVHPCTLGLYTGAHLLERSVFEFSGLPAAIYIYRRNLERHAFSREHLLEEIEITLLHELGHHLGYDENDLDELGIG